MKTRWLQASSFLFLFICSVLSCSPEHELYINTEANQKDASSGTLDSKYHNLSPDARHPKEASKSEGKQNQKEHSQEQQRHSKEHSIPDTLLQIERSILDMRTMPDLSSPRDRLNPPRDRHSPDKPVQDAPPKQICPKVCTKHAECQRDACGAYRYCDYNSCRDRKTKCPRSCTQDKECRVFMCGTYTKCINNKCTPPPQVPCPRICTSNADCAKPGCTINKRYQYNRCMGGQCAYCSNGSCKGYPHTCPSKCSINAECNVSDCFPMVKCRAGRCQAPLTSCPTSCTEDIDCTWKACGKRKKCYLGKCVEKPANCTQSGCPTGKVCHKTNGLCVECVMDKDCPSGKHCHAKENRCVECTQNNHCSPGKKCLLQKNRCVECFNTKDCPSGKICTDKNICKSHQTCGFDGDCEAGKICGTGKTCVACEKDEHCPFDKKCETKSKRCVSCTADADCRQGFSKKICVRFSCQSSCRSNTDCGYGTPYCQKASGSSIGSCVQCLRKNMNQCGLREVCDTNQYKCIPKPNGSCKVSDDCSIGHYCSNTTQKCTPGCTFGRDCPRGTHCHGPTKRCIQCLTDSHCSRGYICSKTSQTCIRKIGCQKHTDCYRGFLCHASNKTCYRPCSHAKDCSSTEKCVSGRCIQCNQDKDCAQDERVCKNNKCETQKCTSNADCPNTTEWFCSSQRKSCVLKCVPSASGGCKYNRCQSNKDCSGKQRCSNGLCVPGCRSNADCPLDPSRKFQKYCLEGRCAYCLNDSHCSTSSGYRCVTEKNSEYRGSCRTDCEARGGDFSCKSYRGSQICNPQTKTCSSCYKDSHCKADEFCAKLTRPCGQYQCESRACRKKQLYYLCKKCKQNTDCGSGNLCLNFPCDQSPKEQKCGFKCDANTPCPGGFRCASIPRGGKVYKQCVPFTYTGKCKTVLGVTCLSIGEWGSRYCRSDADCPKNPIYGSYQRLKCVTCTQSFGKNSCSGVPHYLYRRPGVCKGP